MAFFRNGVESASGSSSKPTRSPGAGGTYLAGSDVTGPGRSPEKAGPGEVTREDPGEPVPGAWGALKLLCRRTPRPSSRQGAGRDEMFPSPRGRGRRAGRSGEDGMCWGASPGRAKEGGRRGGWGRGRPGSRGVLGCHRPAFQDRRVWGYTGFRNPGGGILKASGF